MEIILPNKAIFDTELQFDNQTQECQAYFFEVMNASEPTTIVDEFNRPLKQTWTVDSIGFEVSRITEYATQCGDWNFSNQYHVTVRKEWHEDKNIQIIIDSDDFVNLTKDYPDFVASELKARPSYSENKFNYQYLEFLLEEHKQILLSYNTIINYKDGI